MRSYDESRKFNSQHNVNGVFVVYKNIVLQVLEGEATAVANAAYRIRRDSRFERCSIIVNCDIETPYFKTWFIRLVQPGVKTPQTLLAKLKKVLENDFVFESPKDRKLYEDIFIAERNTVPAIPIPRLKPSNDSQYQNPDEQKSTADFSKCALSISAWPKPTQMRLTPPEMKTCSLLSHQFVPYKHLLTRGIWQSEPELFRFLNKLQNAGVLQIKAASNPEVDAPESQDSTPVKSDRFSQLLKKFITTPKKQAN
jgi:hypothetical protein